MRDRRTFDSSSTPKLGALRVEAREVAAVDLDILRGALKEEVEKAKEDDPKELRRRIADLERQLRQKPAAAIDDGLIARAVSEAVADRDRTISRLRRVVDDALRRAKEAQGAAASVIDALEVEPPAGAAHAPRLPTARPMPVVTRSAPAGRISKASSDLSGPEQRILDAVAWMESIGVSEPEQTAVAFLADYTIGGGAFNNPRGALRTKGLIDYRGGKVVLTDAGRSKANWPDHALTADELQRKVLERLPGPEQKILRVLLETYPKSIDNDTLARRAGYEPGGGAFNNPRGRLRTLGLIDYPERGRVAAEPLLFLQDRR